MVSLLALRLLHMLHLLRLLWLRKTILCFGRRLRKTGGGEKRQARVLTAMAAGVVAPSAMAYSCRVKNPGVVSANGVAWPAGFYDFDSVAALFCMEPSCGKGQYARPPALSNESNSSRDNRLRCREFPDTSATSQDCRRLNSAMPASLPIPAASGALAAWNRHIGSASCPALCETCW